MSHDQRFLAQDLSRGLQKLGLVLSVGQQASLMDYLALMEKWNAVYNLTAIRDPQQMLIQHLLDSLSIVPVLQRQSATPTPGQSVRLLDVGSGGGLPGIPLAVAMPQVLVTLIDPVHKKTAFLTQVKAALHLGNVRVITGKVEAMPDEARFEVITSRAFASLADFVQLAQTRLAPLGFFAAMKGVVPASEIAQLPSGFVVQEIVPLQVPGLAAERCLVLIKTG